MRERLDQYPRGPQQVPRTALQELVDGGYMRAIPEDPMTQETRSGKKSISDYDPNEPDAEPGIEDVQEHVRPRPAPTAGPTTSGSDETTDSNPRS